jgi:hypothetical protein
MVESSLEQYRREILAYVDMEYTQAQIIRALQERFGVVVKRSTLSDYIKALMDEADSEAVSTGRDRPQEALVSGVMQGANEEIINRLVQLIEGVGQLRQEGEARHAAVMDALQALPLHDTLDRHSREFKALFDLLKGTALWKIWLRALLFTGMTWGVVLAALYGYFRGWPF